MHALAHTHTHTHTHWALNRHLSKLDFSINWHVFIVPSSYYTFKMASVYSGYRLSIQEHTVDVGVISCTY